jgi:hypothetical protein
MPEGMARRYPFGLSGRVWAAMAVAVVLVISLLLFGNLRGRMVESTAPGDTTQVDNDGGSLPPALDRAIDRLEDTVQP